MSKSTILFIILALLWQIAIGILYGFYYSYHQTAIKDMQSVDQVYYYVSANSNTPSIFRANTTQFPFPHIVIGLLLVLLLTGLALVAAYIQRSSITSMANTLLIFALTAQNFLIFRNFWNRVGVNGTYSNFSNSHYDRVNLINFGNDLEQGTYGLPSASFMDVIGAALAMYAAYSAVIGRVGFGEVFFFTWIGTFLYECNSQLLWRFWILDTGFPSRAFAFGGTLGIVSSLVLGKRELTQKNENYRSSYKIMGLSLLGIALVWCVYPLIVLGDVYVSTTGKIVAMSGQVNIWLALAGSVLGCYTASSLVYRRFSLHDIVFSAITGGIAFSSSTNINYNPGAAMAIGYTGGFLCSISQTHFKRQLNKSGVVDSNSALFNFLLPSFIAAIFSALLQGMGEGNARMTVYTSASGSNTVFQRIVDYRTVLGSNRSYTQQGGYQMAGWCLSVGFGLVGGVIVGLLFRCLNDRFSLPNHFFTDGRFFENDAKPKKQSKREGNGQSQRYLHSEQAAQLSLQIHSQK